MLLDGTRREQAVAYVEQVLRELESPALRASTGTGVAAAGVARGAVGSAVTFATAAKVLQRPALRRPADGLLEQAQIVATTHATGPSMFTGLAGICWGYEYVAALDDDGTDEEAEAREEEEDGADESRSEEEEDADDDPKTLLLSLLDESAIDLHYDLLSGIVGIANYALLHRAEPRGEQLVSRSLDILLKRLHPVGGGMLWFSQAEHIGPHKRIAYPQGLYDLGIAHGSAGALACLSAACGVDDIARSRAVRDVCAALRASEQTQQPEWGRYGTSLGSGLAKRVGWCYGDLGMSFAFAGAGRMLREPPLSKYAEWLAEQETLRVGEHAGIRDAALCHGAAGAAHLFHLWYRMTGREVFAAAALRWFDEIYRLPARFDPALQRADDSNLEYLEGKAGTVLALLSALSETHYPWDYPLGLHHASLGPPP